MKIMNVIGIAIVAIGGYLVGKNQKEIWQKINSFRKSGESIETSIKDETDTDVPPQPTFDISLAKEELIKKINSFSNFYEAIFEVSNGTSIKTNEVIAEWNTIIHYLKSCPNIQQLWLSLFENNENFSPEQQKKNASSFLEFIFSTGIERDNRKSLIVGDNTKFQYYTLNGEAFTIGTTMKVMLPCWSFGDKILEKGILTLA